MKAFIIGRPYHLFNTINYVVSTGSYGDAFIVNEYPQARHDFERVREAGIFERVYFVEESSLRPSGKIKELIYVCKRALFPWRIIKRAVVEPQLSAKSEVEYSEIYSATPGTFVLTLLSVSNAKYIVIEDGAATYSGKDFLEHQSFRHRLYCLIFRNGAMNVNVDRVLVYRPEMCKTLLSPNIEALPAISTNNERLMSAYGKVFNYDNDNYKKKYIFLSQRLLGLNCPDIDLLELISEVFSYAGIEEDYCFRLHPAEQVNSLREETRCFPHEMWELICMKYIYDDNVLVTINSTAAFSPYKIYNREPFVIFIYRVVGLHDYDYEISEVLARNLKEQYSDPSKIYIPGNMEELRQAVIQTRERNEESGIRI